MNENKTIDSKVEEEEWITIKDLFSTPYEKDPSKTYENFFKNKDLVTTLIKKGALETRKNKHRTEIRLASAKELADYLEEHLAIILYKDTIEDLREAAGIPDKDYNFAKHSLSKSDYIWSEKFSKGYVQFYKKGKEEQIIKELAENYKIKRKKEEHSDDDQEELLPAVEYRQAAIAIENENFEDGPYKKFINQLLRVSKGSSSYPVERVYDQVTQDKGVSMDGFEIASWHPNMASEEKINSLYTIAQGLYEYLQSQQENPDSVK